MKITTSGTVSSKPLVLKEGVVADNDILSYEEFATFIREQFSQEVLNSLMARLNQIEGCLKKNDYRGAYLRWENLEKDILLNKNYSVSLLFIENINLGAGDYSYQYATKEYDVLGASGKLSRMKQLSDKLFKESIEEQISYHLEQFITDIATQNTRWKFIQKLFALGDSDVKRNAANARWHTKDWTYKNILYGNNPVWQGNAADAFMNHMAHMHVQLMATELSGDQSNLFATSVFNEEKDNIWDLLYASKNTTSWITGGDIIFKYGDQLYNIQLKTGQETAQKRRSRIGGKLATADLLNFIHQLKIEIKEQNIEQIIDLMYKELKTSGWVENINHAFANEIENMIQI